MDHSIVLYLVSHVCMVDHPRLTLSLIPSYRSIHFLTPNVPPNQIGPDGSFLDFFTQSMQPPDIVGRIKRFLAQATRVTK